MLNVEFMWNSDSLPDNSDYITQEMISEAIANMKTSKATGPSGTVIEMIRSAGKEIVKSITKLANRIIKEGRFPQSGTFHILSVYLRVKLMLSLETSTQV